MSKKKTIYRHLVITDNGDELILQPLTTWTREELIAALCELALELEDDETMKTVRPGDVFSLLAESENHPEIEN